MTFVYYDKKIFKNVLYKKNSLSFEMSEILENIKIDLYSDFSLVYTINYYNQTKIGMYIPECSTCVILFKEIDKYIMLVNENGTEDETDSENGVDFSPILLEQMFDSNSNKILDFIKGKELDDITLKINK